MIEILRTNNVIIPIVTIIIVVILSIVNTSIFNKIRVFTMVLAGSALLYGLQTISVFLMMLFVVSVLHYISTYNIRSKTLLLLALFSLLLSVILYFTSYYEASLFVIELFVVTLILLVYKKL